ncbi:MAG: phosphotransferase, partial [Woeseiaceae bacterium]|nr:phosphotransferase [Woeseiaceae bacterium]
MRYDELKNWLQNLRGTAVDNLTPASSDASFRRYFRWADGTQSFIAMDAPPPQEDCVPFIKVAGYLEAMNLNAPRVIDAHVGRGFLLLTDLGDTQYLEYIESHPDDAARLYDDAIAALLRLQEQGAAFQAQLPPYDVKLLDFELSLFHDWLCGTHLGIGFSTDEEMQWRELCSCLIRNALDQPQVFVHRDYHSRNLMVMDDNNPGILDFQDAV